MSKLNRRQFMAITAASCVAGVASGEQLMTTQTQLIHTAYFWLKNPDSIEDREQLIAGLQTLDKVNIKLILFTWLLLKTVPTCGQK